MNEDITYRLNISEEDSYVSRGFCLILVIIINYFNVYHLKYNRYNLFLEDKQVLEFFDRKYKFLDNKNNNLKINFNSVELQPIVEKYSINHVKYDAHTIANISALKKLNETFNNTLILKSKYLNIFEHTLESLNINNGTLGIHIRGTDKYTEVTPPTIENIFKKIDYFLNNFKITNIFVATDDMTYLNILINKYNSIIIYNKNNIRSTNSHPIHYDFDNRSNLNREVLLDVYVLSKCKYFIYSFSNVSCLALIIGINNFDHILNLNLVETRDLQKKISKTETFLKLKNGRFKLSY
jgi:hypothetical protein